MQFDLWIPGKPHPQARPRFTKYGQVYIPRANKVAQEELLFAYTSAGGPLFTGPVGLDATFSHEGIQLTIFDEEWSSPLRGDLTNYLKTLEDALNKTAWNDDRQVVWVSARKS